MNRLDHDGIRWELTVDFAPLLAAVLATPGRTVKESAAKLVTVHATGGEDYFIKRYRHAAVPLRSFAYRFKKSPARVEWELAQKLATRDVPVVRHLALGERWRGLGLSESILITEGFAGTDLTRFRDDPGKLAAVVTLVNRMHAAGVLQRDLHPGNILMSPAGESRLVDLDGASLKPALTPAERNHNLAYLCIHLPLPVPAEVRALTRQVRSEVLAARSARCFRTNREFGRQNFGGRRWTARHPWFNPAIERILAAPDEFLNRARSLKAGRSSTVGAGDGLVLKRYNLRRWFNPLKNLFRASRARKNFQRAYHLELLGIATARPIATGDERRLGFPVRSFFLMEEIPDAVSLPFWTGDKRAAARAVAGLLAQVHHEGFSHRDLKDGNIVFKDTGKPHLIDLDGLSFLGRPPTDAVAAADLARLAEGAARWRQRPSRTDRLRFLQTYCRARELPDWRWWWHAIGTQLGYTNKP